MRYYIVARVLGNIIVLIAAAMLAPLFLALFFGEAAWLAFMKSIALTLAVGLPMSRLGKANGEIRRREGYAIVTLSWLAASFFGGLPYLFAGTFDTLADALFETASGFTTTGASVMTDIEIHSRSIIFWRGLTHWLGGMGIVVLFVALLSQLGTSGLQLLQAEAPGPTAEKLKPRIQETAKILWLTYVILTAAEITLLVVAGMPLFDAVVHTFATLATGGFSSKNLSIGFYDSVAIQWIITVFMIMSGANFALYYQAVKRRNPLHFFRDPEFKLYVGIILAAIALIVINLAPTDRYQGENLIRQAAFQVASIITTTGFATTDFDQWPNFSRLLLLLLMFVGGCYGSTGGAIKVGRVLVLVKNGAAEFYRAIHPHAVTPVRLGPTVVRDSLVINVLQFIGLYFAIFAVGTLLMSLTDLDLTHSASSVAATLGNVGPGLGVVGPSQNYAHLPAAAKYLLTALMLIGRLEIFTVLVLFQRAAWRR